MSDKQGLGFPGNGNSMERRFFDVAELRVAQGEGEGKPKVIRGYAAVFGKLSVEMYGFREKIAKGAFASSIANGDDVRALWNHAPAYVLGRTKNSTLSLAEDETGLLVEITPPDTEMARGFLASIERGDVDQMSFGFRTLEQEWDIDENDQYVRTLTKVKLYEVSPVTFPAYTDTSVGIRSEGGGPGETEFRDPLLGWIPAIPADVVSRAELRRAASSAAGADQVRARLGLMRRRLELLSK